jgi:cyclohexanone monooxygenase
MTSKTYDVVVVGAGFAGLYAIHRLRKAGYSVRVLEAGSGVGGTWYWNRYPGARCDIESMQYSYSFSNEIQQEWTWSELFAGQAELLAYANFVADKLDLMKDITFNSRVRSAAFDESTHRWTLTTESDETYSAGFCIMATGCLSAPLTPNIEDMDVYEGDIYRTSLWPQDGVDFMDKTVGLIGTGSTGIQTAPIVAQAAKHLHVFQRTANYSLPAKNRPLESEYVKDWKDNYVDRRRAAVATRNNTLNDAGQRAGADLSYEEREAEFNRRYETGGNSSGIGFMYTFTDMSKSKVVNDHASEFIRRKIAETVHDPEVADTLTPKHYGVGGRRLCVDTNYFETFNRPNVTLVDAKKDPIKRFTRTGLMMTSGRTFEFDAVILAIGFDGMTGALSRIDVRGTDGVTLNDHWLHGPQTYLCLSQAGFPNMFLVNGPGSPSVLSNMITSIEQHVDWIVTCIDHVRSSGHTRIGASEEAESAWFDHVNETAAGTLLTSSDSWYIGANVPGKPRYFMVYLGGTNNYNETIGRVAAEGYRGFTIS